LAYVHAKNKITTGKGNVEGMDLGGGDWANFHWFFGLP
jgi:hypothetical protein